MANIHRTEYRAQFCDKNFNQITVDFKKRMPDSDPIPAIKPITLTGVENSPMVQSYKEDNDYVMTPINGSECTFNIVSTDGFDLKSMYTADETEWLVEVSEGWRWHGYIIPDSCSEPFAAAPYEVTIRATDRLGVLKDVPYMNNGLQFKGFSSDLTVLKTALSFTGLSLQIVVGVNTLEATMDLTGPYVDPLFQTYIEQERFYDIDGNGFSCQEVIRSILQRWGAQLHQWEGKWQVINVLEKSKGPVPARVFSNEGLWSYNTTIGTSFTAGGNDRELQPVGTTMMAKALASSTAYYQYGYPTNRLRNGDFQEGFKPQTTIPLGWNPVGPIDISYGNAEADPSDIYIKLNKLSGSGSPYMASDPVLIRAGEKVSFSMDLLVPSSVAFGSINTMSFSIHDGNNNYFWNNGWASGVHTYIIFYSQQQLISQISVRFEIDPRDADYQLTIGIGIVRSGATYYQTQVNNVTARPSLSAGYAKPSIGQFNRQTTFSNQSYRRDPVLLLHCDERNEQRTSQIRINNLPPSEFFWKRAGYTESVKLLTTVSNSELTLHQRPYYIFQSQFIGEGEIGLNTLLSVDLLQGKMIFMSGDFDVMRGTHSLRFAEAITDKLDDTKVLGFNDLIEDYGGVKDKDGVSVGSPGGVSPGGGGSTIDTNAFIRNQTAYQTDAKFNVSRGVIKDELIVPTHAPTTMVSGEAALWIDNLSGITADPGGYVLPIATSSILGGIKIGSGLTIDPVTGVVNVSGGESPLTFVAPLVRTGNSVSIVEDPSHRFVTDAEISNWNAAFGWGNHAAQGYLKTVSWDIISGRPTNLSQFTNDLGNYGNWITKSQADGWYSLLGHTHVWADITNRPTNLSQFTNDLGNYGNWITKSQADIWYEPTFSVLPVSKGGTGSSTRNFVDFGSNESIQGIKTFDNGAVFVKNLIVPTQAPTLTPGQASIWIDNLSGLTIDPSGYILPIATASILGGVKVGSGLLINPTTGVLSVNGDTFDLTNYYTKAQGDARYAFVGGGNASGTWGINITGKSDGAGKLWSSTHPDNFYLFNEWDGTYWQLKSNHPSLVNVGRADSAGNSIAWNGQGYNGAEQSGAITYLLGYDGANWRPTTYTGVVNYLGLNSYMKTFGRQENSVDVNTMLGSGVYGISNSNPSRPNGQVYTSIISALNADTGLQIAGGYTSNALAFRGWSGNGSSFTDWRYVWHSGNLAQDINPTGFTVSQRDANGYIEANFFRSKVSANSVQSSTPSSLYGNAIGNDGYHYSYSSDAVKAFLGLTKGGKFHQENQIFGVDANTVEPNTSSFTYNVNAPHQGAIVQFGSAYGLQLNGAYLGSGELSFRNLNGDNGTREDWRTVLWNGYNKTARFSGGVGSGYINANVEIFRQGEAAGKPNISFHWGGVVASQIAIGIDGVIEIRNNPGTDYESLRAFNLTAQNNVTASANLYVSGQAYNSGWYRSNSTGAGWYHELHGGGICMMDNAYIRTFGGKSFLVDSGNLLVHGFAAVNGIVESGMHFRAVSNVSMVGNYDQNQTGNQVIWTIGNGWETLTSYYGLGYEYEKRSSFGHTVNFAADGVVAARVSLSTGQAWFNGAVVAPYFTGNLDGNAGSATVLQTARTLWGQSFNGSGNVSGALTGVSDITGSGTITMPTVKATAALKIPTVAPTLAPGEAAIWIDNLSGITL